MDHPRSFWHNMNNLHDCLLCSQGQHLPLKSRSYFQATNTDQFLITAGDASFTSADGSEIKFPYISGNNLPLMIPGQVSRVGLTFENALLLQDWHTPSS